MGVSQGARPLVIALVAVLAAVSTAATSAGAAGGVQSHASQRRVVFAAHGLGDALQVPAHVSGEDVASWVEGATAGQALRWVAVDMTTSEGPWQVDGADVDAVESTLWHAHTLSAADKAAMGAGAGRVYGVARAFAVGAPLQTVRVERVAHAADAAVEAPALCTTVQQAGLAVRGACVGDVQWGVAAERGLFSDPSTWPGASNIRWRDGDEGTSRFTLGAGGDGAGGVLFEHVRVERTGAGRARRVTTRISHHATRVAGDAVSGNVRWDDTRGTGHVCGVHMAGDLPTAHALAAHTCDEHVSEAVVRVERTYAPHGMHGDVNTRVHAPPTCDVLLRELVPSTLFLDTYQLGEAARMGGPRVSVLVDMDLERPAAISPPHVAMVAPTRDGTAPMPLHLRYQAPATLDEPVRTHRAAVLPAPAVFLRCGRASAWHRAAVHCEGACEVHADTPVGHEAHEWPVTLATLAVTGASALVLLVALVRSRPAI